MEEISGLTSPLSDVLAEIFQFLHILASEEDQTTLLEFTTGILIFHWILCHGESVLSPFWETFSLPSSEIQSSPSLPTILILTLINVVDFALATVDSVANYNGIGFTSFIQGGDNPIIDGGSSFSVSSSQTNSEWASTKIPNIISPTAFMIIGPLAVITLTCIMPIIIITYSLPFLRPRLIVFFCAQGPSLLLFSPTGKSGSTEGYPMMARHPRVCYGVCWRCFA